MPFSTVGGLTSNLLATASDITAFAQERVDVTDTFIAALGSAVGNLQPAVIRL